MRTWMLKRISARSGRFLNGFKLEISAYQPKTKARSSKLKNLKSQALLKLKRDPELPEP